MRRKCAERRGLEEGEGRPSPQACSTEGSSATSGPLELITAEGAGEPVRIVRSGKRGGAGEDSVIGDGEMRPKARWSREEAAGGRALLMPLRVLFAAHVEGRVGHGGVRGGRRMAHHVYTAAVDLVRRVNHHLSAGGGM